MSSLWLRPGQISRQKCCRRRPKAKKEVPPVGDKENTIDKAYTLGRFDAPFLQASEERMDWLEKKVGHIYSFGREIPNLRDALMEVRRLVKPLEHHDLSLREPLDDLHHCRNLIAQDYDPQRAFKLSQQYLEWRAETRGGVSPSVEWVENSFVLVPFEDSLGRPVAIVRAKYVDPSMSMELMEIGFRSTVDGIIGHFLHKRQSPPSELNPLEQYIVLLDVRDAGLSNFSHDLVRMMVREGAIHYPERLALVIVLGANFLTRRIWGMASPMMHHRTRNKFKLLTEGEAGDYLKNLIGRESIPPPVSPHEAKNLEEVAGSLLAASWRRFGIVPPVPYEPLPRRQNSIESNHKRGGMCCW